MSARLGASHDQFEEWERLLEKGESPYQAAKLAGTTLTRLRTTDRERQAIGLQYSRERRAALVDEVMDATVKSEFSTPTDRIAWAKANHEGYRDKSTLEITGTLNHEAKVVSLGDLLDAARESGLDLAELAGRSGRSLPSAEDVLSAPAEPQASAVPAERQA